MNMTTNLKHGQRVVMASDLDDLKKGMRGTVYQDAVRIGVQFDSNESVSISRIHPMSLENVRVIDCVTPI